MPEDLARRKPERPTPGADPEIRLLFPVPVVTWRWQEAVMRDAALFDIVDRRRRAQASLRRSNKGGWHSDLDLPSWPEEDTRALVSWIVGRVAETSVSWREGLAGQLAPVWRVNGWANVNERGATNDLHKHSAKNWHWSAVYYLRVGGAEKNGGALVFEDVGSGLEPAGVAKRAYRLVPEQGSLVVFPSWLYHRVEPHSEDRPRVSFAFNLHNAGLEAARLWTHRKSILWRRTPQLMRLQARLRGYWDQSGRATPPGADIAAPTE